MSRPSAPTADASDAMTSGVVAGESRARRRDERSVPRHRVRRDGPSDLIVVPVVLVAGCLVETLRSPSTVLHPELWAEDGLIWFHDAYTQGWLSPLIHPQVGYLQTFSRLVADLGLLLPLNAVPALFVAVALVVQVLPAALVASRRYAVAVPDVRVRLLLAGLYLVIPNSNEINVNLTDAQWHLGLLAVLVVLAVPATGAWRVFDVSVMVLSGLTGPFVLSVVVVAAILYYYRRRRWTLILAGIAAVTGTLQIAAIATSTRGAGGPLGASGSWFIEVVGGRLFGETVLGTATTESGYFTAHRLLLSTLLLCCVFVLVGVAVWKGPLELRLFNLFAFLELAAALVSPLASLHGPQWPALAAAVGARYWVFPSLALLVDLIWLLGQWRTGRWIRIASLAAALAFVVVCAFGIREDFRYPGTLAPSWVAQVHRFNQLPPHRSFTFRIRPPGWTMTLTKK